MLKKRAHLGQLRSTVGPEPCHNSSRLSFVCSRVHGKVLLRGMHEGGLIPYHNPSGAGYVEVLGVIHPFQTRALAFISGAAHLKAVPVPVTTSELSASRSQLPSRPHVWSNAVVVTPSID